MNVVFDLDGTLADCTHRHHFLETHPKDWDSFYDECWRDRPIQSMLEIFQTLVLSPSYSVEIWTGRIEGEHEEIFDRTVEWFGYHLHPSRFVSKKNLFVLSPENFFDHCNRVEGKFRIPIRMRPWKDYREDSDLKYDWFSRGRGQDKEVDLVFEDRARVVKMWRGQGIRCCQVAPGEF